MANCETSMRTNYFTVTDEKAYEELFKRLHAEGLEDFSEKSDDGRILHGFGSYDNVAFTGLLTEREEVKTALAEGKKIFNMLGDELTSEDEIDKCTAVFDENKEVIADVYDDDYGDIDDFIEKLQKILPENECFVYMEIYKERLRYVGGYAIVATKNKYKSRSLENFVDNTVEEFLGEGATTKYTY